MRHVFEKSLNVLGAHRLVFGTDSSFFPRGWHAAVFARQVNALRQLNVSPADAQAIFGGNLTRLLARPASHQ
jgi:predicted TIM-barrel fold metal-dependent hydrolase